MLEGICPKCNQRYYGWALQRQGNQHFDKCGYELFITENGRRVNKS
jgi:hypothetical protein